MSLDTRLSRVATSLSARERAILVLRSLREKTPEDPAWRSTMPPEQTREFNRLIVLMNACNIYLPLLITANELMTERLFVKLSWLLTMSQFGSAFWNIAGLVPVGKRKKAEKLARDVLPLLELPWDPEEHELSWLNIADQIEETLRNDVVGLWQQVRAIDVVVGEVAAEFDGWDPLRPILRDVVEKTRASLQLLHEFFSLSESTELPEPDDESLELVRAHFENGRRLLSSL